MNEEIEDLRKENYDLSEKYEHTIQDSNILDQRLRQSEQKWIFEKQELTKEIHTLQTILSDNPSTNTALIETYVLSATDAFERAKITFEATASATEKAEDLMNRISTLEESKKEEIDELKFTIKDLEAQLEFAKEVAISEARLQLCSSYENEIETYRKEIDELNNRLIVALESIGDKKIMEEQIQQLSLRISDRDFLVSETNQICTTLRAQNDLKDKELESMKGSIMELHRSIEQMKMNAMNSRF